MKWLKRIGIGLLAVIVLLVIVGFALPRDWEVTRSRVIAAEPAEIHAFVGDWAKWPQWSPFEAEDPDMVITLGEDTTSVGATRTWTSKSMGDGSQTITRSDPESGFDFTLEMPEFPPIHGVFEYEEVDGGTNVTWTDTGKLPSGPLNGWFGMLLPSVLGEAFEQGLADLDEVVTAAK